MPPAERPRFHWSHVLNLGLGLGVGAFWLIFAWLRLLETGGAWWRYAAMLAPGAGVLALVLLARRDPLPYGAGLIALGVVMFLLPGFAEAWATRLAFGLPLILDGAAFILWRRHLETAAAGARS